MSDDDLRAALVEAAGQGESVDHRRQVMFQSLIDLGPDASVLADDVAKRLAEPNHGGHASEYLMRLAGSFGEKGAPCVPALTQIASDHSTHAAPAVVALGQIGAPARSAVGKINQTFIANWNQVNFNAIQAITRIGGDDAKAVAQDLLTQTKDPVKVAVGKWSLATLDPADPNAGEYRAAALAAIPAFITKPPRGNYGTDAAYFLAAQLSPESAKAVLPLLADDKTRPHAVEALYAIQTGVFDQDSDRRERDRAIHLPQHLLELKPDDLKAVQAAVPSIIEAAKNTNSSSSPLAAQLLGSLAPDNPDALDAMIGRLSRATDINDGAIIGLALAGKPALPKLLEKYNALKRNDRERGWTLAALVRIDPKSVPDLDTVLNPPLPLPEGTMSEILAMAGSAGRDAMLAGSKSPPGHRGPDVNVDLSKLPPGEDTIVAVMKQMAATTNDQDLKSKPVNYDMRLSGLAETLMRASRPQDLPVLAREIVKLPADAQKHALGALAVLLRDNKPNQKKYLADPSPVLRRAAAESLSNRPFDAEQIDMALDMWSKETDPDALKAVEQSMQSYGGAPTFNAIAGRIDSFPPERQMSAIKLIGSVYIPETAGALETILAAKLPATRAAAVAALFNTWQRPTHRDGGAWPPASVQKLAADPDAAVREAVVRTLVARSPTDPISPLTIQMLGDSSPQVRGAAAEVIIQCASMNGKITVPPQLIGLMDDPDPEVRGRLRNLRPGMLNDAAAALQKQLQGDRSHQLMALELMQTGAPASLWPEVKKLLASSDPLVRSYAVKAAAGLPADGEVLFAIASAYLKDADAYVRFSAYQALAMPKAINSPMQSPQTPATRPAALKFPDAANDDDRHAVLLVRAYREPSKQDTIDGLLAWMAATPTPAPEATLAMARLAFASPPDKVFSAIAKQPPLVRTTLAIVMPMGMARTGGPAMQTFAADIGQIAQGNDHAATLAKFALATDPATQGRDAVLQQAIDDSDPFVRVTAMGVIGASRRTGPPATGLNLRELALKRISDPDPYIVLAAQQIGSSSNAFGDGGVRQDQMSRSDACQALSLRIGRAFPVERTALIQQSLQTAGDSPFFVTMWISLLTDPDPAVRTACVQGLRHYSDVWIANHPSVNKGG